MNTSNNASCPLHQRHLAGRWPGPQPARAAAPSRPAARAAHRAAATAGADRRSAARRRRRRRDRLRRRLDRKSGRAAHAPDGARGSPSAAGDTRASRGRQRAEERSLAAAAGSARARLRSGVRQRNHGQFPGCARPRPARACRCCGTCATPASRGPRWRCTVGWRAAPRCDGSSACRVRAPRCSRASRARSRSSRTRWICAHSRPARWRRSCGASWAGAPTPWSSPAPAESCDARATKR